MLWGGRVMPLKLQTNVLIEFHNNHPRIVEMKNLASSYICWPFMDEDIENISKFWTSCKIHQNMPPNVPIHSWENPQTPWRPA